MEDDASQQPVSISTRIAALKLNEVGRAPATKHRPGSRPPPPAPPAKRPPAVRGKTTNNPPLYSYGSATEGNTGNQSNRDVPESPLPAYTISRTISNDPAGKPSLPPRVPPRNNAATPPKPVLPPRRPSSQSSERRASIESQSSGISTASISSYSSNTSATTIRTRGTSPCPSINSESDGRKLPPVFDPSALPVQFEQNDNDDKTRGRNPQKSYWASTSTNKLVVPRSLPPPPPSAPRAPSTGPELEPDAKDDWREFPCRPEPSPNRLGDWKRPTAEPTRRPSVSPRPSPLAAPMPKRSASMFGVQTPKSGDTPPPIPPRRPSAPTDSYAGNGKDVTPPPLPLSLRPKTNGFRNQG